MNPIRIILPTLCLISVIGCASRLEFPPMGEPLPISVKLEIPPALRELRMEYTNGCGHLMRAPLGVRLEEALVEGAQQTFTSVSYEGRGSKDAPPEAVIRVELANWSFNFQQDNVQGRVPANLQLNAIARVFDLNGNVLRESPVTIVHQEHVHRESIEPNCDYIFDPFMRNISVDFATKISMDVRQAFRTTVSAPQTAAATAPHSATTISHSCHISTSLQNDGV